MPTHSVEETMHKYKEGDLHSGSKSGPKVKSRKQAIAIAMSEAGESKKASVNRYLDKLAGILADTQEKRSSYEEEKGNNAYIKKIAAMEEKISKENKVIKDDEKAMKGAAPANNKFFVRTKLRGV